MNSSPVASPPSVISLAARLLLRRLKAWTLEAHWLRCDWYLLFVRLEFVYGAQAIISAGCRLNCSRVSIQKAVRASRQLALIFPEPYFLKRKSRVNVHYSLCCIINASLGSWKIENKLQKDNKTIGMVKNYCPAPSPDSVMYEPA